MNQQDLIAKLYQIATRTNSLSSCKVLAGYLAFFADNPRFTDVNFDVEGQQIFIHQAISYLYVSACSLKTEFLVWLVRYRKAKGWRDDVNFPNINDIKDLALRRQIYDDLFLILNSLQEHIVSPSRLTSLNNLFFAHDLVLKQKTREFASIFWMEYIQKIDELCQKNHGKAQAQILTASIEKDFLDIYINKIADAYLIFAWHQKSGSHEKIEIQIPVNDIEDETRIEVSDNLDFFEAFRILDIMCYGTFEF